VSGNEEDPAAIEARLLARARRREPLVCVRAPARAGPPGSSCGPTRISRAWARTLARLDVSVLHGLVLDPLLGIGRAMARSSNLTYSHDLRETLRQVAASKCRRRFS